MPISDPIYILHIVITIAAWIVIIYFINLGLKQVDDAKVLETKNNINKTKKETK